MFRPSYELASVVGWLCGALALMVFQPPFWQAVLPAFILLALLRARQVGEMWRFRLSLSVYRLAVVPVRDLIIKSRAFRKDRNSLYIGRGFAWGQRHAEIAQQIMDRNHDEIGEIPATIRRFIEQSNAVPPMRRTPVQRAAARIAEWLLPRQTRLASDAAVGVPWIHGLAGDAEEDLGLPMDALTGHTLILGTTRAGKTRLYELLTTQIIDMGSCLIVFDPKKDQALVSRLRQQCKRTKRTFLYFDAAKPAESIRINPLANWNNISEPATRIGQLVDADGSFAAFAWKTLVRIQRALVAAGEKPNIKNTKHYVTLGVEGLAEKILTLHFVKTHGPEWDRDIKNTPAGGGTSGGRGQPTRLDLMIAKYTTGDGHTDAIDGIIAMVKHSKEHFSKMIQVLEPILEMLGADEIGQLLSPDPADMEDKRPIYDVRKIIDEKAVLYVGLDSLSNKIIASAIGSILLADLASTLGSIYNFSSPADVYLLIDEAAEVMNDQATQILNKGGGAGIKVFLAAQSVSDFVVRYGSKDKAEQVLANLNNLICLRVRSDDTASQYVSRLFGKTSARVVETGYSTGSESASSFTEFRSNVSKNLKSTAVDLVNASLLTRLPPLQFFAFIAGRSYYKGVLPLID
jgi:conjugal transfer pilus assembly protein TraD